jgi:hypothetical protein
MHHGHLDLLSRRCRNPAALILVYVNFLHKSVLDCKVTYIPTSCGDSTFGEERPAIEAIFDVFVPLLNLHLLILCDPLFTTRYYPEQDGDAGFGPYQDCSVNG